MVERQKEQEIYKLTDGQAKVMIDELYNKIKLDIVNKKIKYDGIYGIPRGGVSIAQRLCYRLDLPWLTKPTNNTLVVDDISDSGNTLIDVKHKRIATLFIRKGTKVIPHYYIHEYVDNTWTVFPWEV